MDSKAPSRSFLVFNARICASSAAGDSEHSWMTVTDGVVSGLGSGAPPSSIKEKFPVAHDMEGKRVLPGLVDAHIHVLMYGKSLTAVDVLGVRSIDAMKGKLRDYVKANSKKTGAITGRGWEVTFCSRCFLLTC